MEPEAWHTAARRRSAHGVPDLREHGHVSAGPGVLRQSRLDAPNALGGRPAGGPDQPHPCGGPFPVQDVGAGTNRACPPTRTWTSSDPMRLVVCWCASTPQGRPWEPGQQGPQMLPQSVHDARRSRRRFVRPDRAWQSPPHPSAPVAARASGSAGPYCPTRPATASAPKNTAGCLENGNRNFCGSREIP